MVIIPLIYGMEETMLLVLCSSSFPSQTSVPQVKISSKLRKVGVFLSVEEGQVSFYNTKTGSELYAFRGSEFTERMYPLLGTGDKEVPLVLLTVQ